MTNTTVFTIGQEVIATTNYAYKITEGKKYIVVDYSPEVYDVGANFRFPAYITVIGDTNTPVTGYAYRFKPA